MTYAGVRILDIPAKADREYDYAVPGGLAGAVRRGSFVKVPLRGRSGCVALVTRLSDEPPRGLAPESIREISGALPEYASLSEAQMRVAAYLCSSTLCTAGEAAGAMVPSAVLSGRAGRTEKTVAAALPEEELRAILDGSVKVSSGGRMTSLSSPGQREILIRLLEAGGSLTCSELLSGGAAGYGHIAALEKKKLIIVSGRTVDRSLIPAAEDGGGQAPEPELSEEQENACGELARMAFSGEPKAALLEGVTGSGKTVVMLTLIERVLGSGRGVILLLPEIALTPQTLAVFSRRFAGRVSMMHSGLSDGERRDAYLKIRDGGARLVIGTRSAVFAPLPDLGMIIIDEEQEHTYKSDSAPRYHARDVARFRCAKENAFLLLASATPSLESRYKAETGQYSLIRLTKRYGNASLPAVTVADMRREVREGSLSPIGRLLAEKLASNYAAGGQSILFLNRRGYNNYLSCVLCGAAYQCPDCSVSMTYHVSRAGNGMMVCHWCGRHMPVPEKCPSCGGTMIRIGYGTQKVEEELAKTVPGARVLRMDADTTSAKDSYDSMLGKFRRHEADILLGTQMVTKGHDFPDVTLVGVLLADTSLYYDDYRAGERTFALLTQVIGRAGRRDRAGEAVIQTNNPDHEIIRLACSQDYEEMYRREIKLRRALVFPPFCDIALLTLSSAEEEKAVRGISRLSAALREKLASEEYSKDFPFMVFGPFEAPVYRMGSRYRMRMVAKFRLNAASRRFFSELTARYRSGPLSDGTLLSVDFNPTDL
ncbi:MAG: primosomal protein N' [Clostridia bacterium]|nr:primosomal protein N' [Clostridia bacterium]